MIVKGDMDMTEADVENGARAIMQANGYERFLTVPELYNLPIWRRAKRSCSQHGRQVAMSDEYTPTTDEIKMWYSGAVGEYWCDTGMSVDEGEAAFDRAIAVHDRALRERIASEIEVMLIGLDAWRGSEVIAAHDSALSRAAEDFEGLIAAALADVDWRAVK